METGDILFLFICLFIGILISLVIYIILRIYHVRKNPTMKILQYQLLGHNKSALKQINKELQKDDISEYEYYFLNFDKINSLLSLYYKKKDFKYLRGASTIVKECHERDSIEKYPPIKEEFIKLKEKIDNEINKG